MQFWKRVEINSLLYNNLESVSPYALVCYVTQEKKCDSRNNKALRHTKDENELIK